MKRSTIWLVAAGVGVFNAILLRIFELAVNDGTADLWNKLFQSDTYRWVVIPLAVSLGVLLSLLIRCLGQPRIIGPETDVLAGPNNAPTSLRAIVVMLTIGLGSLLAGASLGPEASLMAAATAIGGWAAARFRLTDTVQLITLASVGALLVAFLGSLIMVLVPLLLLLKQRRLKLLPLSVILLAGVSSFGTLQLIDHQHPGFGTAPPLPKLETHDLLIALLAGFVTTVLALALQRLITSLAHHVKRFDRQLPWALSASIFGLVLGILYLVGGQSTEFSGNVGSNLLVAQHAQSSVAVLAGLLVVKLLATSWSKATGYRGGLVFPSIYIGVALGLLLGSLVSGWGGAGAMIGGIAGMLSAITGSPVAAAVFVLAILPFRLLPVALVAIVGSSCGNLLLKRLMARHPGSNQA